LREVKGFPSFSARLHVSINTFIHDPTTFIVHGEGGLLWGASDVFLRAQRLQPWRTPLSSPSALIPSVGSTSTTFSEVACVIVPLALRHDGALTQPTGLAFDIHEAHDETSEGLVPPLLHLKQMPRADQIIIFLLEVL
jgi:hypothetical protein